MKASDLLDRPERWTQGCSARDVSGNRVYSLDTHAVCWCALGALIVSHKDRPEPDYEAARDELLAAIQRRHGSEYAAITRWNDDSKRTFEEVREVLIDAGQ
jgi:hypothetical protein